MARRMVAPTSGNRMAGWPIVSQMVQNLLKAPSSSIHGMTGKRAKASITVEEKLIQQLYPS